MGPAVDYITERPAPQRPLVRWPCVVTSCSLHIQWVVLLDGGGLCTTEHSCVSRSKTDLGSSRSWHGTFDLDQFSITTGDPGNPFADYNMVFVPYCDGSMHSGQRTVASNESYNLYFSGHLTIKAVFGYLAQHHGLNTTGSLVVFSGGSAGTVKNQPKISLTNLFLI